MDSALQASVYQAIDSNDDVMMRGLGTLIRSKMLAAHWPFLEEAAVATFVSMEASYRLVLRRLRAEGVSDPTSRDAARFVAESFGENIVAERYFEEYYDVRVATLHPESRSGSSAFAPMQADDHLDLYNGLLSMYRYLLIGLG